MNEPIAKLDLILLKPSGEKLPISIQIGTPYEIKDEKGADFARCSVSINGLYKKPHDVAGEDTFQALTLAIAFIQDTLKSFVDDGGRIFFEDGKTEFEFRPYFSEFKH